MINGLLYHSYYEKETRSQLMIMKRSAMSEQQRLAILSNELVRRLSNIHREVLQGEIKEVVEQAVGGFISDISV